MQMASPPVRDLLLVGGGHTHIQVLRSLAMQPLPGVRVTLLTREIRSPYSGMLPGHIAGFYSRDDMHVDLVPLCHRAGVRLIHGEVMGLDVERRLVRVQGRPPITFDWLSLNSGALPQAPARGIAVKPIGRFLPAWDQARAALPAGAAVAVVGAGAGGVELAFAVAAARSDLRVSIVGRQWLPGFSVRAGRLLRQQAIARGLTLVLDAEVTDYIGNQLHLADGSSLVTHEVFWVTDVAAPGWLRASQLLTDDRGFVVVDESLRSVTHPHVLAAGDVACLKGQERAKSGVFAVRAGPILAHNLRAIPAGTALRRFRPQQHFLRLMGTGDGSAVAAKWGLTMSGPLMWRWKDWIDRAFMQRFRDLPERMVTNAAPLPEAMQRDVPDPMRCGGCGAKLGADLLQRVLARLPITSRAGVLLGIGDDAAEIVADGSVLVSTDGLRAMVDDPYRFGRIVTHHNLNDLYAMGAIPTSAVALATIPLMGEQLMEEELTALLTGVVDVLEAHDVPLVGGHSAEGAELFLGLTVTGRRGPVTFTKSGLKPGQQLILTKPVGTGVILAAAMRGLPVADALAEAMLAMDASNAAAVEILVDCGATGVTDVTGFGLLGHLSEMLRASRVGARVAVESVPTLTGAQALLDSGVRSSLQTSNEQVLADFVVGADIDARLLCDPQTSGGLLAGVSSDDGQRCVDRLRAAGLGHAVVIGEVTTGSCELVRRF